MLNNQLVSLSVKSTNISQTYRHISWSGSFFQDPSVVNLGEPSPPPPPPWVKVLRPEDPVNFLGPNATLYQ